MLTSRTRRRVLVSLQETSKKDEDVEMQKLREKVKTKQAKNHKCEMYRYRTLHYLFDKQRICIGMELITNYCTIFRIGYFSRLQTVKETNAKYVV
jgi:hypothetical protein